MESALSHVLNKAHRALALLNHRAKCIGGFHYNTYTMLFNQLVTSQILPTACIWGHKNHNIITALQIQAMRFFLGVGKTCPIAGLFGEMAWVPYRMQIKLQIIKFWHRLHSMSNSRIPSLILKWSQQLSANNWATRTAHMCNDLSITHFSQEQFLDEAWRSLVALELQDWKQTIHDPPRVGADLPSIGSTSLNHLQSPTSDYPFPETREESSQC